MQETAQLAGFLAAEVIAKVAAGKLPPPVLIFENADGSTHIVQIQEGTPEKSARKGEAILLTNEGGAERGVLAIDAYLNLPQGRRDAIFLQAIQFQPTLQKVILAVPYRPAGRLGRFAVHRLKVIALEDEHIPQGELLQGFFDGVNRHERGRRFWQENLDDSY